MRGLTMPSGKVKWFNAKKGYGFITDDETQKDIFLHVSALEDSKLRVLKEAGGLVDFFENDASSPLKKNVLATNSNIHEELKGLISKKDIVFCF
jgi:CspA family cold shock protein